MEKLLLKIRPATENDRDAIWKIFQSVVARGDTFVYDPQTTREQALAIWFAPRVHPFVAATERDIVGTYILKANHPGLGSHVANAAFMVAPSAHGQGVGRLMGEHGLGEARRLGFRAMQFNFVVSTNQVAIHLWQQLGFNIVGTLPGAFHHPERGFVDVHVMFRNLADH